MPEYCSESEGMVMEDSDRGLSGISEDIFGFQNAQPETNTSEPLGEMYLLAMLTWFSKT